MRISKAYQSVKKLKEIIRHVNIFYVRSMEVVTRFSSHLEQPSAKNLA